MVNAVRINANFKSELPSIQLHCKGFKQRELLNTLPKYILTTTEIKECINNHRNKPLVPVDVVINE